MQCFLDEKVTFFKYYYNCNLVVCFWFSDIKNYGRQNYSGGELFFAFGRENIYFSIFLLNCLFTPAVYFLITFE